MDPVAALAGQKCTQELRVVRNVRTQELRVVRRGLEEMTQFGPTVLNFPNRSGLPIRVLAQNGRDSSDVGGFVSRYPLFEQGILLRLETARGIVGEMALIAYSSKCYLIHAYVNPMDSIQKLLNF